MELLDNQPINSHPGQTIPDEQAKAMFDISGVERGNPRVSGAKEVIQGIPERTELFPTRVTIKNNVNEIKKALDLYFYKNDHNEWVFTPEKQ